MTTVTKRLEFDAGHRLLGHEGKCRHLHGHRYAAEITATADSLDGVGRVVDFSSIKEVVGGWIDDNLDHGTIVNAADTELLNFLDDGKQKFYPLGCNPTAENIAEELFARASTMLRTKGVRVLQVKLWETPTCSATYTAPGVK